METILEEIIMKRKTILVSSVTAILLAGLFVWYTLPVDLMDLDHKEVLELVVFNGSSGNATHITDKEQIIYIHTQNSPSKALFSLSQHRSDHQ